MKILFGSNVPEYKSIPNGKQHGVAVFIVMVVMLLGALLVVWSSRVTLFNERVTGNNADYLLAYEAAQALLADAELDILGMMADGSDCSSPCRNKNNGVLQIPDNLTVLEDDGGAMVLLANKVKDRAVPCMQGLCFDNGNLKTEFWSESDVLNNMIGDSALYGEYTGAVNDATMGNPRLIVNDGMINNRALASAWYWIEPIEFNADTPIGRKYAGMGADVAMGTTNGIVYRVTAIANGRKPGTRAIIQSIVSPKIVPVNFINPPV
ncbi:hypothetical protein E9531_12150 [Lampropedia puyangensis]|uniref:PilX/PilW C-terminal domain-containing protein n=1 Tax=Lampropedia puyangensis TaxID=1330072 RepID=A0A4S8EZE1_9BURK|nr:hypothetical protein [Lampropedia puyangensis]THT99324.1 hypothetical protein E9531_12150 [Lampropedia puyangensis]